MLDTTKEKIMNGERPRIGIMGGTFDPLHYGHLAAAKAAYKALDLDEVIFVPAGNPNFKQEKELADGVDRFAMCCGALGDIPEFSACALEISRDGITYTVDTLPLIQKSYRNCADLYFLMGEDAAATLSRWHGSAELAEMATYVVITRPGCHFSEEQAQELQALGFKLNFVEADTPDVSSTEIRRRVFAGESIEGMVPEAVAKIIASKELYLPEPEGIKNPLSDEFYEARKAELKERVNDHRFQHVMGVSELAVRLAEIYDVDVRKARLAGLLHDWDKNMNDEEIRDRVNELNLHIDPIVLYSLPRVLHAHTAAAYMQRQFPKISNDVIQAIDRHTIAAQDMSPLDMVIYIADALEPNREYDGIAELRAYIGAVDLQELFFIIYKYWIIHMMERDMLLHPNTVPIWNHYASLHRARRKE